MITATEVSEVRENLQRKLRRADFFLFLTLSTCFALISGLPLLVSGHVAIFLIVVGVYLSAMMTISFLLYRGPGVKTNKLVYLACSLLLTLAFSQLSIWFVQNIHYVAR